MRRWSSDQKMAAATYERQWQPFSFVVRASTTSDQLRQPSRYEKKERFPLRSSKKGKCLPNYHHEFVSGGKNGARVRAHTRTLTTRQTDSQFRIAFAMKKGCFVLCFDSSLQVVIIFSCLAGYTFVIIWLAKSVVFFFSVISFVWKFWNMNFPQSTWVMTSGPLHSTVAFVSRCFAVLFHLLE